MKLDYLLVSERVTSTNWLHYHSVRESAMKILEEICTDTWLFINKNIKYRSPSYISSYLLPPTLLLLSRPLILPLNPLFFFSGSRDSNSCRDVHHLFHRKPSYVYCPLSFCSVSLTLNFLPLLPSFSRSASKDIGIYGVNRCASSSSYQRFHSLHRSSIAQSQRINLRTRFGIHIWIGIRLKDADLWEFIEIFWSKVRP